MPPIKCIPCRVTFDGLRYRVYSDGSVSLALSNREAIDLGCKTVRDDLEYESTRMDRYEPHSQVAKSVRQEAQRLRRNRNARERNQARRDLGLKKTPYGWE